MEQLRDALKDYSDEYLIEQYRFHSEEYTPEALELLRGEISAREIEIDQQSSEVPEGLRKEIRLDSDDFVPFEHAFSNTDMLLAATILRDKGIMFYMDNPASSDVLPLENEAAKSYTIHVFKDMVEEAHELIDEHFVKLDGMYSLKNCGSRDRLRAFNFHDLHLTEKQAYESLEVAFAEAEKDVIINYGNRLLSEVEQIEAQQERVIFYYDSIELLINKLNGGAVRELNRSDLLAILEILQVFCNEESFPNFMDESISILLGFFIPD